MEVIAGRRATGPSLLYYRVINRLVSRRAERRAGQARVWAVYY